MNSDNLKNGRIKDLGIVLAVFNEAQDIKEIVEKIKKKRFGEIIIVDDNSSDETFNILNTINGIKILRNKQNLGQGYSLFRGLNLLTCQFALLTTWSFDFKLDLKSLVETSIEDGNDITLISGKYKNNKNLLRFMRQTFKINFPGFSTDSILINKEMFSFLKKKNVIYGNLMAEFVRLACKYDKKIGFYEFQGLTSNTKWYTRNFRNLKNLRYLKRHETYIRSQYTKDVFDFPYSPNLKNYIISGIVLIIIGGIVTIILQNIILIYSK